MSEKPEALEEFFRRRRRFFPFFFFLPFLFRIPPVGFFVAFVPRPRRFDAGSEDDEDMCIRRITEVEFMSMRRLGFMEMEVMMQ